MPETKRHAWSDNDLVGQKKTQQDLSENVYELELSASCQNLSNNIHSTKQSKKGNNICLISGISKKTLHSLVSLLWTYWDVVMVMWLL